MNSSLRKRILIICPFVRPNLGGVESHIDKLTSYAIKRGYHVTVLTYQPLTRPVRGEAHEYGDHYEIHRMPWFGMGWFNKLEHIAPLVFLYLFPGLCVFSLIYYRRHHKQVHAIHAHGFAAAAVARVLTAIHEKRSTISTHAVYRFGERAVLARIIKALLNGFDTILAVSEVSRQELIGIGLPKEKVHVHPNWIDTDVFSPRDQKKARQNLDITEPFNVLFGVGRLIEMKGIHVFLDAASRLPDIGFHIVGSGPEAETVEKAATQYPNIHYYGVLMQNDEEQRETLVDLYNAADLLVSPYLYDEGFSTTLIEAAACGTPLIVTERGSPPTFLDPSMTMYLSPEPTGEEVARTIKELAKAPEKVDEMAKRAREHSLTHFGFSNADVIIDSYEA